MPDISSTADIDFIVREFYAQAITDPTIGHFFTTVVKLDFESHIPVIVSFWDSLLLGANTYKGNPMIKHIELNRLAAIKAEHFERWLQLWEATINKTYSGAKASEAIERARSIALLMMHKIQLS